MSGITSRKILNDQFLTTEVQDGKLVYIFDKKQHGQALLYNLTVMQDEPETSLSDVVIISKEDEQFHFHAPILAVLSKQLEEHLLEHGLGSKTSKIVIKSEFNSEAIQCLWDYAYTPSVVKLTPSNVEEVKKLAEHHGLDSLKEECEVLEQEIFDDGGDSDSVEVEFEDVPEIILKRLHGLLEEGKLCTAAIMGSDSLTWVRCHGAIVTAACSIFSQLAHGDSKDKLQVTDAQFQAIPSFLRYLYTAKLVVDPSTVQQLLEIAVTFNLPGMGHACCCWLEDALTAGNALGIMGIAKAWQGKVDTSLATKTKDFITLSDTLNDLYHSARSFVLRNFQSVKDADEFPDQDVKTLIDITSDDSLAADSEKDVFYAVMRWVEVDPETRNELLPNLLETVRLELTDIEFLEIIKEHSLLKVNSACMEIINEAIKEIIVHQNASRGEGIYPGEVYDGAEIYPDDFSEPLVDTPDEIFDDKSFRPGKKSDMRRRENRKVLNGKNIDGTPDKRLKENRLKKPDVVKKLTFGEDELPRRKDGKPDRRFRIVKELQERSKDEARNLDSNDDVPCKNDGKPDMRFKVNKKTRQGANPAPLPQGPTRKDGKPDMRFKANRLPEQCVIHCGPSKKDGRGQKEKDHVLGNENAAASNYYPGPLKKDGTPDMRFAVNKRDSSNETPRSGQLKKDGAPDMRFNRDSGEAQTVPSGPLKKDGTPDMRYSSNRSPYDSTSTPSSYRGSASSVSSGHYGSSSSVCSSGPLKRDGTPDMRYSSNKGSYGSSTSSYGGSASPISSGYTGSSSSFTSSGPLKRDGTPDMRYSSNKGSYGSSTSSYGGSASPISSGYTGSSSSFTSSGPLKRDGTPDMRYSSNRGSYGSSGSSSSNSRGSTSSYSSSRSGSSSSFTPSGPLKRDGTPDMRYASNRR